MNKSILFAAIAAVLFTAPLCAQLASSSQVGFGCGPAAVIPELNVTPPVIGGVSTLSVLHSLNPFPVLVFVSPGGGHR